MLNGVLVGFGIMLASLFIPIVHYVAAPLSPFVAGFIGSGIAEIDEDGIVKFGGVMAGLMLIPAASVAVAKLGFGLDELIRVPTTWWIIGLVILVPYTWFGATVGAWGGYVIRKNQANEQDSTS